MRKSRAQTFLISAFLFFGLLATHAFASGDDPGPFRARAADLSRTISDQTKDIGETSILLDQLSTEIHSLKRNQEKGPTLLRQYRLQARLQKAQEISDRLARMSEARRQTESELRVTRKLLAGTLDRAIESKRSIANSSSESWKTRGVAAHDMERLLVERMQLSAGPPPLTLPTDAASLLATGTLPDDTEERVNALRDLEHQMMNEIVFLQSELADVRRQRFLRTELTHLMDEENFFAEQGFVRGGTNRTDQVTLASNLAKGKPTSGNAAPVSGTPGSTDPSFGTGVASAPNVPATGVSPPSVSAPPPVNVPPPSNVQPSGNVPPPAGNVTVGSALPSETAPGSALPSESLAAAITGKAGDVSALAKLDTSSPPSSIAESTSDKSAHDPLAQLASEFGLPPEQKRDVQTQRSASDGQTQWLQNRISTIRLILSRLQQKIREFEQKSISQ